MPLDTRYHLTCILYFLEWECKMDFWKVIRCRWHCNAGWSNSEVFSNYLHSHFIKYCHGRIKDETLLILYDGHRSHVSVGHIEWAKYNNTVLFVLPSHTSHTYTCILQPMDIDCFGPLQVKYAEECTKFARLQHRVVTRYGVWSLVCKAYVAALSPANFQKCRM